MSKEGHNDSFADMLNKLMYQRGFTPKDLSNTTGISEATISKYRNGTQKPSIKSIVSLSKALGCGIEELANSVENE